MLTEQQIAGLEKVAVDAIASCDDLAGPQGRLGKLLLSLTREYDALRQDFARLDRSYSARK